MDTDSQQVIDRVSLFVESLKGKYPIAAAYLFGSWAENRAHEESDVDIGLVFRGGVNHGDRADIFSLGKDFDLDFDVVVLSEHDFETEDPVIVHEIKTKGKRIA